MCLACLFAPVDHEKQPRRRTLMKGAGAFVFGRRAAASAAGALIAETVFAPDARAGAIMRLDCRQCALSTEPAELNCDVALRRNGHVDLCKALVRSNARVDAPREGCHSWRVPHGARMQKRRPRAAQLQHATEWAPSGAKCSSVPCRARVPMRGAWRAVRDMPRGAVHAAWSSGVRCASKVFACLLVCVFVPDGATCSPVAGRSCASHARRPHDRPRRVSMG